MKFQKIIPLFVVALSLSSFGCQKQNIPESYLINNSITHKVNSYVETIGLYVDYEHEYFLWQRKIDIDDLKDDKGCRFKFDFSSQFSGNEIELYTSDDFVYIDESGERIPFIYPEKESRYRRYEFYGSKTIKISFENAADEIKKAIESKNYTVYGAIFTWVGEALFLGTEKENG